MAVSAFIFGGIGALVETSDIQYQAFKDALKNAGVEANWSRADYQSSLSLTGGINRLSKLFSKNGQALTGSLSQAQIIEIHEEKTRLFTERLRSITLPLRPGVEGLIKHALTSGIVLAWATTTSKDNIEAVIATTKGALKASMFAFIGNNHLIQRQKPDPEIYQLTLSQLGLSPDKAIAIEDSITGVASAQAAGIKTIAFPGAFNLDKDFSTADIFSDNLTQVFFQNMTLENALTAAEAL
jgi:HAD superfamily hydrolase (TIGR01509 family)